MAIRFLKNGIQFVFFLFLAGYGSYLEAGNGTLTGEELGTIQENQGILEKKTIDRFYDPIEIRSEILEGSLGEKISELSLYSFSNGSFRLIPFQFDEWTEDGYMVFDQGEEANDELGNGILDKQDMLVFMARDAGDKVSRNLWPKGASKGIEVEVLDPLTDNRGWCYLLLIPGSAPEISFRNNSTFNDKLRIDGSTYKIICTNRVIKNKIYKTIINEHVLVKPEAGGDGKDFIDRLKFRVSASLLFGMIRTGFHEDNFIGDAKKFKTGPVRSIVRQWFGVSLPFGLKSPKIEGDVYIYDTIAFAGAEIDVPFNPGYILTNYKMSMGYDLHYPNAFGMRWYNSNNTEGFLVDGVTSPMETRFDGSFDSWRCIVGPNGWMVHRATWDEYYFSQADLKLHFTDDLKNHAPPENYPGSLGSYCTVSTVKSLQPRKYFLQIDWYLPFDFYDPDGLRLDIIEQIVNIRDDSLKIKVGSHLVTSRGGITTSTEP